MEIVVLLQGLFPKNVWNITFCPSNRNFKTDPSKKRDFQPPPPQDVLVGRG